MREIKSSSPVKVYALGGLGEIGKNTYCVENDNTLIIIDAGIKFPEDNLPGINYVIPDYTHLKENRHKIKALFITHGHEDHIGAIPFLLQSVFIPVIYAPRLAAALIRHKLEEHRIKEKVTIVEYVEEDIINCNDFQVEFFHVTHSIPDAFGISISTPEGRIVTTGDFKVDLTPIGSNINLPKMMELGNKGVTLLLADSTSAEKEGYTLSERTVINSIFEIFSHAKGRLIISTFSSNVARIQQIVEGCMKYNRKLVIFGRSMENTIKISRKFGYIKIPNDRIVAPEDLRSLKIDETCIICTGSQGEELAALSRISNNEHKYIKVSPGDTVVFSSSPIPGNTGSINKVVNKLTKLGAEVLTNSVLSNIHASGHPSKIELRLIQKIFRPKYFLPVHGEYHMLKLHSDLAVEMGMPRENTFVFGNGDTLIMKGGKIKEGERIITDAIYIDGNDANGLQASVIRDRNILCNDGMVSIVVSIDSRANSLLIPPTVFTRGVVYGIEDENVVFQRLQKLITKNLEILFLNRVKFSDIKECLRSTASKFFFELTRRTPMIIPLIMNKIYDDTSK